MNCENRIRILQLRRHKRNFSFRSSYEGPILTKGGRISRRLSEKIRSGFHKDAGKCGWKVPPRARIAITFDIFCNENNPPEIYRIVKYYLDLLQGPVFENDRQVHYLEASIWRSNSRESKSSIYIQARRLIQLYKIWDIYQNISHDFHIDDYDEQTSSPYYHLIDQNVWDIADRQYELLRNVNISPYDRPGLGKHSGTTMSRFSDIDPLTFDLGHLPGKGELKDFKNNVARLLSGFGAKHSLFNKIYLPIEIDLQVTKAGHKYFTDLDNVATYICTEFRKTMLCDGAFINGYRIYVVDEIAKGMKADVRLKLLPPGEIRSYNDRMNNALSAFEKRLRET